MYPSRKNGRAVEMGLALATRGITDKGLLPRLREADPCLW